MKNTILLVDDEPEILKMLSKAFGLKGYNILQADSGEEGLQVLSKNHCLVMFLDLNLPGINGLELCHIIKTELPVAICYAVTGHSSMFELADCREAGFDDYFTKPAKMETLFTAAETAFEKLIRWQVIHP
jgi:CheY-like chemotaxis protein